MWLKSLAYKNNRNHRTKRLSLRSFAAFLLIQTLAAALVAGRYLAFLPAWPQDWLGQAFIPLATFAQMALLSLVVGAAALPVLLLPKRWAQAVLALMAALALAALWVDTLVFAQYRFHISAVMLELLLAGQVIEFSPRMWLTVGGALLGLWALQWLLLALLDRLRGRMPTLHGFFSGSVKAFAAVFVCSLLLSHFMHIWAAAHAYQSVTQLKRYLPLFYPATSNSTMRKLGWIDEQALERQRLLTAQQSRASDLRYPRQPLQTSPVAQPPNILFLVIDSWRYDSFNAEVSPHLWRFAQRGMRLEQHLSSGNATRTGIFGLFYSLPGTYWHSVLDNRASPVLLDRLQALDYDMGIFASAQLRNPEFDQTVFSNIEHLRVESPGKTTVQRDLAITREWLEWFKQRNNPEQPFFSFLFYDSPHNYELPPDYPAVFQPMLKEVNYLERQPSTDPLPWFNRYRTSVHFVDSLAAQILQALEDSGKLENTLVLITGDHGEEFNDNGLNYWGHNSNFSYPQVHVPMALVGVGIDNVDGNGYSPWGDKLTSHADIVPTLMRNYLGVHNPLEDYATGLDLLAAPQSRPWLLSAGYSQYALVTPENIVEIGALGQYTHVDRRYRPLKAAPPWAHVQQAMEQLRWFQASNPPAAGTP